MNRNISHNLITLYRFILNEKRQIISAIEKYVYFNNNSFHVICIEIGPFPDSRFVYLKLD